MTKENPLEKLKERVKKDTWDEVSPNDTLALIEVIELYERALSDWCSWEKEQIKKEGPYAGKEINHLIKQGNKALETGRKKLEEM